MHLILKQVFGMNHKKFTPLFRWTKSRGKSEASLLLVLVSKKQRKQGRWLVVDPGVNEEYMCNDPNLNRVSPPNIFCKILSWVIHWVIDKTEIVTSVSLFRKGLP